jgi:hypothetical protein
MPDASPRDRDDRAGGGTHFDDPEFISKFGFGLPNASINQSLRTDVYTRTSPTEPFSLASLDIREVADHGLQSVGPTLEADLPGFVAGWRARPASRCSRALRGVRLRTASVILHFFERSRWSIIDSRVLESLGHPRTSIGRQPGGSPKDVVVSRRVVGRGAGLLDVTHDAA